MGPMLPMGLLSLRQREVVKNIFLYFEGKSIFPTMFMRIRSFLIALTLLLTLFTSCHPVSKYINAEEVLDWEPEMVVMDSLNAVEFSDENTLLVTGSSSVRLWDSIHIGLAPYQVMQRGYGGARLTDYNHYADRIIKPHRFKAILVFVANDISGGDQDRTPREVLQLFKTLVKQIRERNSETPVFWIEITPTPSRWHASDHIRKANALIKNYCEKSADLNFIPTFDVYTNQEGLPDSTLFRKDMLHLNQDGYNLWAQRIKQTLQDEEILP